MHPQISLEKFDALIWVWTYGFIFSLEMPGATQVISHDLLSKMEEWKYLHCNSQFRRDNQNYSRIYHTHYYYNELHFCD